MASASQLALEYAQEVAVGDDWSESFRFTTPTGQGIDISGWEFTAQILTAAGVELLALTQSTSAHEDDTGDVESILTISTLDIALAPSVLYRWLLRTSTLADRGLLGGPFRVAPVGRTRTATPAGTAPTVVIGSNVVVTLDVGAIGATGPAGTGEGGSGTPASTVTAETTLNGAAAAVGTDTEYARQDHTHGTPAMPSAADVGADVSGAAAAAQSAAIAAAAADATTKANAAQAAAIAASQPLDAILTATTASFTTADETKLDQITVTQPVDLDQLETDVAALANGMVYAGEWDASAGTFPTGANTGAFYLVTVGGTVDSVSFAAQDRLIATTDGASTTVYAANWSKLDATDAVTSVAGLTGNIAASGLRTALNVEDGADVTDATNVAAAGALIGPVAVPDDITATGTASATTFLRGDGAWATPAGGSAALVRRWDFTVAGDRTILPSTGRTVVAPPFSPPGFAGSVARYQLAATLGAGAATPTTKNVGGLTIVPASWSPVDEIVVGERVRWSMGVSYEVKAAAATVPGSWPSAVPGLFDPVALAGGEIATGYLGSTVSWVPNFPIPQFDEYAGTWLWAGYATILTYEHIWTGGSPPLTLSFGALQEQNSYDFFVYFLDMQVIR